MLKTQVQERPSRAKLLAAFAAVYLIWGSTYLAIRYAIETLPPYLMAGSRFLVAGTALYIWARWRGAERPSWINWRAAVIVGVLLLFGGNGNVVWAEQRVPSGLAALIVATAIIIAAVIVITSSRTPSAMIYNEELVVDTREIDDRALRSGILVHRNGIRRRETVIGKSGVVTGSADSIGHRQ